MKSSKSGVPGFDTLAVHAGAAPEGEALVAAGAGPDAIRLSIGIEDVADIIADLDQALAQVAG